MALTEIIDSYGSPCACVFMFRCRVWCQSVISHKLFDHVVLVFIFLNCITIALERPDIQPNSTVRDTRTHTHSSCVNQLLSTQAAVDSLVTLSSST